CIGKPPRALGIGQFYFIFSDDDPALNVPRRGSGTWHRDRAGNTPSIVYQVTKSQTLGLDNQQVGFQLWYSVEKREIEKLLRLLPHQFCTYRQRIFLPCIYQRAFVRSGN